MIDFAACLRILRWEAGTAHDTKGKTKMKKITFLHVLRSLGLLLALGLSMNSAQAALQCGSQVSGNVVLTQDLNCAGPGLIVSADNTTIDLNGHTISCSNGGYLGSCQNIPNGPKGILSTNHKNVQVKGPGVITGFHVGIFLSGGPVLSVHDLVITGPPSPDAALNARLLNVGVVIANASCQIGIARIESAKVYNLEVSNHMHGVQLSGVSCATVQGNFLHDNNGSTGDSHGISIIGSNQNYINRNLVHANGVNKNVDSGIFLVAGSSNNSVVNNTVLNNCGNGIAVYGQAANNNIAANAVRFSGGQLGAQCLPALVGAYNDLAQSNQGVGNQYNPNNACRTQGVGIPAGVCNPGE